MSPELHGAADYYQYRRDASTFPIADLAELAAKLGAIRSFDGRGDIAWADSFEAGLIHWAAVGAPAGFKAVPSVLFAEHGGLSAKLTTAGSGANRVELEHTAPHRNPGLNGFEVWFMSMGDVDTVRIGFDLATAGKLTIFEAEADIINSRLRLRTGSTTWQVIRTGVTIGQKETHFHRMKFVLDPVGLTYSRLMFNRFEDRDLTVTPQDAGSNTGEAITLRIQVNGTALVDATVHTDVALHTWDEPP